jgi:hypothetical protein
MTTTAWDRHPPAPSRRPPIRQNGMTANFSISDAPLVEFAGLFSDDVAKVSNGQAGATDLLPDPHVAFLYDITQPLESG